MASNLRQLVALPLRAPQLFEQFKIKPPRGVLLWGPPGSGEAVTAVGGWEGGGWRRAERQSRRLAIRVVVVGGLWCNLICLLHLGGMVCTGDGCMMRWSSKAIDWYQLGIGF